MAITLFRKLGSRCTLKSRNKTYATPSTENIFPTKPILPLDGKLLLSLYRITPQNVGEVDNSWNQDRKVRERKSQLISSLDLNFDFSKNKM